MPGQHVDDVGGGAVEPDGRQHFVQQLARAADEGQAGLVFLDAGRFADEHDARFGVAVGEHGGVGELLQRAAFEGFQRGL